jgi:hypothetical protein
MPGLPPLTKYTNGVSTVESDMDGYMPPVAASDRDELSEAITSETEHAENARLQEAKNILTDYISLLKNGTKQNTPMLAK